MKSVARTSLLVLAVLGFLSHPTAKSERGNVLSGFPRLTLWAWEMPEHLDFIDPREVSVAYLDQTVYLAQDVHARPRLQPMNVPPGTLVIAVVRVEMRKASASTPGNRAKLVSALLRSARHPGVVAVQVDFDAVKSQQAFYRAVLQDLRRDMPPGMPLSITALDSWCAYDRWLTHLPLDEAVPMLFRMGKEQSRFRSRKGGPLVREPLCSASLGLSTDEAWPKELGGKRLYVFNPRPWTEPSVARVLEQIKNEKLE